MKIKKIFQDNISTFLKADKRQVLVPVMERRKVKRHSKNEKKVGIMKKLENLKMVEGQKTIKNMLKGSFHSEPIELKLVNHCGSSLMPVLKLSL
jgi:hypothetical protein